MNVLPEDLERAAQRARELLSALAREAAVAGAAAGRPATAGAMAATARAAIFTDALLGAMRARLEELKAGTR
jgi:hypothetical protein